MAAGEPSVLRDTPSGATAAGADRDASRPQANEDAGAAAAEAGAATAGDAPAATASDAAPPDRPAADAGLPARAPAATESAAADMAEAAAGQRQREPRARRPSAPVFHVAGFWRRAAAACCDLAIIAPVVLIACWLAGRLTGLHVPLARHRGLDYWLDLVLAGDPAFIGAICLSAAIACLYALLFQMTLGRTAGMGVLKIRIIDIYGDEPSAGRVIARTAGYLAGAATLGLGLAWIAFDGEKRGLHDFVAGTYVVKA